MRAPAFQRDGAVKLPPSRGVDLALGPPPESAVVRELLARGCFEAAAQCLHELGHLSKSLDGLLATTLAAAERVVLARGECQVETIWHARAQEEGARRGDALETQLVELLNLASIRLGALLSDAAFRHEASTVRVWQHVEMAVRKIHVGAGPGYAPALGHQSMRLSVRDLSREPASIATHQSQTAAQPAIAVHCLGAFQVLVGFEPIDDWNGHKSLSVFKYLLIHRRVPVPKESLAEVFWPEAEPEAARRNLHQAIYSLRQTLRRASPDLKPILFDNECYHVPAMDDLWLDCDQFEQRAHTGTRAQAAGRLDEAATAFTAADALYQGNLLEEDLSEEWSRLERERLRDLYFEVAHWLVTRHIELGQQAAAVALSQKVLARDTCHEPAYRWLMSSYFQQGLRHLAIRQFQSCVDALRHELQIGPSEETVSLYKHIIGDTR